MKKRIISCLIAAALIASGGSAAFAAGGAAVPPDVKGGKYEEAVKALMEADIVSGYKDGTFRPHAGIERAEACAMIVKFLSPAENELKSAKDSSFSDMNGYGWAANYINYAVEQGIVRGYENHTFRPGGYVTYEETAAMLVNALGYEAKDLSGDWPRNYVDKAKELGLFKDIDPAQIGERAATRGDVASMVYQAEKPRDSAAVQRISGGVGETLSTALFDFKIKNVAAAGELAGRTPANDGYQFIVADVWVKNTFKEELPVGNYDFNIAWGDGADEREDYAYWTFMDGMYPNDTELDKDAELSGKLVFEAPRDQKTLKIFYRELYEDGVGDTIYEVHFSVR